MKMKFVILGLISSVVSLPALELKKQRIGFKWNLKNVSGYFFKKCVDRSIVNVFEAFGNYASVIFDQKHSIKQISTKCTQNHI